MARWERLRKPFAHARARVSSACGAVAEWSKALAWKVSIRQKRIEGSNPSRSATIHNLSFFLKALAEVLANETFRLANVEDASAPIAWSARRVCSADAE